MMPAPRCVPSNVNPIFLKYTLNGTDKNNLFPRRRNKLQIIKLFVLRLNINQFVSITSRISVIFGNMS